MTKAKKSELVPVSDIILIVSKITEYKLNGHNYQAANLATSTESAATVVTMTAEEFARYSEYQESLKAPTSVSRLAETGKTALVSSSNKWIIDSGATDHMTGNPENFTTFIKHSAPHVTMADGSTYEIKGSGHVKPTSSITLSSVLSIPKLAFNLISVSKITKSLNCCASFFPDHCVFQDLLTKKIFGKGHVSNGLYVLDEWTPQSVACIATSSQQKLIIS